MTCFYDESYEEKNLRHRRFLLNNAASKAMNLEAVAVACASTSIVGELRQFGIEDVMTTGDIELASNPCYN